jgi:hypothetical protein
MTTPEQMAVGTRILKAVARNTVKSLVVATKDGLNVEIQINAEEVMKNSEKFVRFYVSAGIQSTSQNRATGCTDALEAHGFWGRDERARGYDDSDPEEEELPKLRMQKHLVCLHLNDENTDKYPAKKLYELIRDITDMALCSCKSFFITDGGNVCFDCAIKTAANAGARVDRGMCGICHESVTTDDATACCKQPMHAACLDRSMEATPTCPLCRQPGAKRARLE